MKLITMNSITILNGTTRHFAVDKHRSDAAKSQPRQALSPDIETTPAEVLVPMDFSVCALNALQTAVSVAQRCGARITLVYVMDLNLLPSYRADMWKIEQSLIAEAEANFTKVVRTLPASIRFATKIVRGRPWEQILRVARERGIDLIVMGKRKSAFWSLFRRQTVRAIMEKANCDVILVAENNKKS